MYHVSHDQNRTYEKCWAFALASDQQQQCSSIMMHSSGYHAARRQRRSHAPIPSRQPRSVCTSTWSLPRARYVSECCVLSLCVTRVENLSSYDHFIQQFIFHRKTVWDWLKFFSSRMTLRAGFTSPARPRGDGGATRETDSIFRL